MEADYIKAGNIAARALDIGKKLVKEDAFLIDVANAIEKEVFNKNAKLAFPVNISINHIAAHNTVMPDDARRFGSDDLVKLDIGVHINGFIADTATTIDLSKKNSELVIASKEALDAALKSAKPGIKVCEIGSIIHDKISSRGFSPIKNLSGHMLNQYKIHGEMTIPNYDNGDNRVLGEGMVIAIEPFATTGEGIVT